MFYDREYNSFKFSSTEIEIILDSLSYTSWNDKCLSEEIKNNMRKLYSGIDKSLIDNHIPSVTAVVWMM
jgi:hypothetical protein